MSRIGSLGAQKCPYLFFGAPSSSPRPPTSSSHSLLFTFLLLFLLRPLLLLLPPSICHRADSHLLPSLCYQVTYDISELDSPSLVSLRSSLLSGLRIFSVVPGSRPILVQVCLAIADLAVQMMEWNDVVHGLVEEFGKEVEMVPALLEFLRVLPEEVANPKITITVSSWGFGS